MGIPFRWVHPSADSIFTPPPPASRLKAPDVPAITACPPSGGYGLTEAALASQPEDPGCWPSCSASATSCSSRSGGADGFLVSYWIRLKVVDLSKLNHPNEFAAVTSHQKHILGASHEVLASTQGAEETGALSPGRPQKIESAPQAPRVALGTERRPRER